MSFKPEITLVHSDARGEMYSISLPDNRELMLLHSPKGSLRGGHSHSVPESVMVLTGEMRYHKISGQRARDGAEYTVTLREGMFSPNAAWGVHMGEFLEDTWLIEWKHARIGQWTQENYAPWREKVDAKART